MLDWKTRCAAAGVIASGLATLIGCGISSTFITPSSVVLGPGQAFQFSIARTGLAQPVLLVNGVAGGSPSNGTITPGGLYTAPSTASGQQIKIGIQGQSSSATVTLFNPASFTPGSVVTTQNPLVASYSMVVPAGASVQVQFGLDVSYGLFTSLIQAATEGGEVTVLVAGMRAGTTYHMQAIVDLIGGSQLLDADHSFTTGSIPAGQLPDITAQQFGTGTPSDGIELLSLDPVTGNYNLLSAVATDLEGNVIWYYDLGPTEWAFPIKPMTNGHMLVNAAATQAPGVNEIREIDLAGNIINRVTLNEVNQALSSIASFQIGSFHHDVAVLPNGHWILLGNYEQTINNVPGVPPNTSMTGDALIDWDPQQEAVWTWSTFDHLDLAHAPYGFTDWTHSNAIIYSPDDGDLILSMRNQNWIIKINYQDGAGDGSVLWRLGFGGDFTLPDGEAPIEWNYGQHYPTIVSPNSAGVFSIMFFNDGNDRLMDSNNDLCGAPGVGACYSSVPLLQLDESTKTATVLWEDNLLPYFSICCGDALLLPNGDMEVDIAYDQTVTPGISDIEEVTQTQTPELVWEMQVHSQLAYRGFRIPSLYPGQVWPATMQSNPRRALPGGPHGSSARAPSRQSGQQLSPKAGQPHAEIVP
jgi:arylsulfate sulfotransferase